MKKLTILLLLVLAVSCTKRKVEPYRENNVSVSAGSDDQRGERPTLVMLQERMAQGDIKSTEALVEALNAMNHASLLGLEDPDQYRIFEECLQSLKAKEATMREEKDRKALRFGIVTQLRMLALDGPTAAVRKSSIDWLVALAEPEAWGSYPEVMEEILESLATVVVRGQARDRDEEATRAGSALKTLANSLSSRSMALPAVAQKAIKGWLAGQTLEDKLRSMPASEGLFSAINREEAPKEYDMRRQLITGRGYSPAVPFFVGRAQELDTLRQSFQAQQERIIAPPITGPGGIGKTQLALKVIEQQRQEAPYDHVFWIPAESSQKLLDAYLRIAEDLGIYIDKKDLKQAAQTVRTYLQGRRCLYVFDDAPDMAAIQDFLPLGRGHVLITSRNSNVNAWPMKQPLLVDPLSEAEALALAQEFGYGQSSQAQEALQSLLEQVPCYPLTLVQLFSTLETQGVDAAAFLDSMQHYTATAQEQALITLLDERPHARVGYPQSVVYVLKTSLERLSKEQHGEKARQLISQLAYLDPKGIPVDWLLTWDREDTSPLNCNTQAALSLLEKYSLIQWDRADEQAYLHAETQLMVRHLHPQASLTALINSLVDYVGDRAEALQNAGKWSSLLPQGRMLFERLEATRFPQEGYELTKYLADACRVGCLFTEGVSWANKCLAIAQSRYPNQDHPDVAHAFNSVGVSLGEVGRHQEALEAKQEALAMRQRLFKDQDHADVAYSLSDVGSSLSQLGLRQEALASKQEALAMRKRLFKDQDHPDVAHAFNSIGELLTHLGHHQEALEYKQEGLAMRQRLFKDQDHPDVARSLNSVGISLEDLGHLQEALESKQEGLAMRQRLYPTHPDVAHSLNNVGDTFMKLGNPQKGVEYCQQALALRERLYQGQDHPYVAQSLNSLGKGYVSLGQYEEGLASYKQAVGMALRVYQRAHPQLTKYLQALIETLNKVGKQPLVQQAKDEIVPLCRQVLGKDDPLTQELLAVAEGDEP